MCAVCGNEEGFHVADVNSVSRRVLVFVRKRGPFSGHAGDYFGEEFERVVVGGIPMRGALLLATMFQCY